MIWVVGAMLCFAATLNYLDRGALGIVTKEIYRDLRIDDTDYSQITAAFLTIYAFMYPVSGYVIDRLGTRLGYAIFIFFWSVAQILHGFVRGKWSLMTMRLLLGISEPGAWPGAAKTVDEWFPADRRALGIGVFNSGTSLGSILAPIVVALVTQRFGWRAAFVATGALGLLWMAAWLFLYNPPHRNRWLPRDEYERMKTRLPPPSESKPAPGELSSRWRLLRARGCWVLIVTRFFTDPVIFFMIFWGFKFLRDYHKFTLDEVARYSWIPYAFGGIGYLFGGWLSGRLMDAGWTMPRARKFVMALGAAVMPVAIAAPYVPNGGLAIAAMCFTTFGHALWVANLQTLPTDMFHGPDIGTVTGFTGFGGSIGGAITQLGIGYVVARVGYAPLFLLAGILHPFAAVLTYWLLPDRIIAAGKT